jgi:5-(carboxyamino)imidazole ribonucleotide mutase
MQVTVLIGSDSDWPIVKECCETLKKFGIHFEAHVLSAHRSPIDLVNHIGHCEEKGCAVYICAAGKAAHLAGVVAAHTTQPVIGIPLSNSLDGLDSLFSTVQMPPGIPVATVAIDGGINGAILAVEILALTSVELQKKLLDHRNALRQTVQEKDQKLHEHLAALLDPT